MSLRFSRVNAMTKNKASIFLVGGVPESQADLNCWTAFRAFAEDLEAYDVSKGTIRIPWSSPLPADLISRIAKWCFEKYKK